MWCDIEGSNAIYIESLIEALCHLAEKIRSPWENLIKTAASSTLRIVDRALTPEIEEENLNEERRTNLTSLSLKNHVKLAIGSETSLPASARGSYVGAIKRIALVSSSFCSFVICALLC